MEAQCLIKCLSQSESGHQQRPISSNVVAINEASLMKTSRKTIHASAVILIAGLVGIAQAQTTIFTDNFEGYTAGTSEDAGWGSYGSLANYSLTVAAGTGVGGSQGLTWKADFLGSYSGYIPSNIGYSGGNPSGNTDPNINDYTLSFEMAIPSGVALNQLQLTLQGWEGQWFSGAQNSAGQYQINTSAVTVGGGFQLITVNLGAINAADAGNFDPLDQTYQFQWQLNGWQLAGGGPVTGEQVTIDNLAITMVPEPATLALIGLGMTALLVRRRKG